MISKMVGKTLLVEFQGKNTAGLGKGVLIVVAEEEWMQKLG
jgi:hypothetical protein